MQTGTVKWFSPTKGYGFVEPIGLSDLKDGQKISYNIESHKGKISAIDIKLI